MLNKKLFGGVVLLLVAYLLYAFVLSPQEDLSPPTLTAKETDMAGSLLQAGNR